LQVSSDECKPAFGFFRFAIATATQHFGSADLHLRKQHSFSLLQIWPDDYKPAFGFRRSASANASLHFAFAD